MGGFKSAGTKTIRELQGELGTLVRQRNYFEHVIRNEESLQRIRQYIHDNPARWDFDRENPFAIRPESKDSWRNGQSGDQAVAPTRALRIHCDDAGGSSNVGSYHRRKKP